MSQDDTLSYKNLFALLDDEATDDLTKDIIKGIKEEYDKGHTVDFSLFLEKFNDDNINCPRCDNSNYIKYGHTNNGTLRYRCKECGKVFNLINKSLLFSSKVNISAWLSFIEGIVSEISIKSAARKAKISLPTASYWMKKIFFALKGYQDEINIDYMFYLDETYYSKEKSKLILNNGLKLRGLSVNQYCVLLIKSDKHIVAKYISDGKPKAEDIYNALKFIVNKKSIIYHDSDSSHDKLIKELDLISKECKAKLPNDKYNEEAIEMLKPINEECKNLNFFLDKHRGFKKKDDLQNYLNLYAFIVNHKNDDPNLYKITYDLFLRIISSKNRIKF